MPGETNNRRRTPRGGQVVQDGEPWLQVANQDRAVLVANGECATIGGRCQRRDGDLVYCAERDVLGGLRLKKDDCARVVAFDLVC